MVPSTKTPSANVSHARSRTARRRASSTTPPTTPVADRARRRRAAGSRGVARRHAITGPTPIRKSSARPSGALTRLKNGGPTVIFTPRTHSEITGKTVPQKTAKAMPTRIRLLKRNADSRERNDSSSFSLRSSGRR